MFDLKDPEVKKAFDAALAEAMESKTAELQDSVSKLQENNAKLLKDLREARKSREIDPAEHQKLEEKLAEVSELLETERKTVKKQLDELAKQTDTFKKQYESEAQYSHRMLVEAGLTEALVKGGVLPHFMDAAKAMFGGQVKVVPDGDIRKAVIGDKPLAEHIAAWTASDQGKHFIGAPVNNGGANGGRPAGDGGVVTVKASDKAAMQKYMTEIASGKVKVDIE